MPRTFVFIQDHTGIVGQVWHVEQVNGEGKEKVRPVFTYAIPDNDPSTLSKLIERFKDHAKAPD